MLSATQTVEHPRLSFGAMLTMLLFRCISKHTKRIFYIASLCGQFDHYSHRRTLAMAKLNEAMRLAYREPSLTIPASVHSRVWQDTGLETILTEQRLVAANDEASLRALARQVVDISKKWWYGDVDEMTRDVTEALTAQRQYLVAA